MPENTGVEPKTQTAKKSAIDQLWGFVTRIRSLSRLTFYKLGNIEKANMELGIRQMRMGNYFDAALRFKFVLWMNKSNTIAYYLLGKSFFYRGKLKQAVPPLQQALKLDPSLEEAKFLLACCGTNAGIKAIPRSFIIDKLDLLSVNYEQFVENVSSKTNTILEEEIKKIIGDNMGFNVLDLGARGGDTAQILRSTANSIVGVEASLRMIGLARNRRVNDLLTFNQLVTKFPEDYLRESKEKFSVVLCTYYLDNLGPLEEFFKLVANVIEPSGIFAFNTHLHSGAEEYFFRPNVMMFSHPTAYIEKLAEKSGFKIAARREVKYVNGSIDSVYVLVKS